MATTELSVSSWGRIQTIVPTRRSSTVKTILLCGRDEAQGGVKRAGKLFKIPSLSLQRRPETRNGHRKVLCLSRPLAEETTPKPNDLTVYKDSCLEVMAQEYLTVRIARLGGVSTKQKGYDGLLDVSRKLVHGLPPKRQRDIIRDVLHAAVPKFVLFGFQSVPKNTFIKESFAMATTWCFTWLVGNCEVREREINGKVTKSTVYIKKCRYLENSKCVGLCVNLCKNPTEEFFGKQFGMPLTMNPNFEDMSCEMIYGLEPPPLDEDAAYRQSCYDLCKSAKAKSNCT